MILAFIDTETTGLEPGHNRVLEAGLQLIDATKEGAMILLHSQLLRQRVDLKVSPWAPEALRVNGYYDEHPDWVGAPMADTPDAFEKWRSFADRLTGAILCSQNVGFDRSFLKAEFDRFELEPKWDRRAVDLQALSAVAAIKFGLPRFGLHQVYTALGGPKLQEHRAMADIERGKFVFEKVSVPFFAA